MDPGHFNSQIDSFGRSQYSFQTTGFQEAIRPGFALFGAGLHQTGLRPCRQGAEAAGQLPAQQRDFALASALVNSFLTSLLKAFPLPLFCPFDNAFG